MPNYKDNYIRILEILTKYIRWNNADCTIELTTEKAEIILTLTAYSTNNFTEDLTFTFTLEDKVLNCYLARTNKRMYEDHTLDLTMMFSYGVVASAIENFIATNLTLNSLTLKAEYAPIRRTKIAPLLRRVLPTTLTTETVTFIIYGTKTSRDITVHMGDTVLEIDVTTGTKTVDNKDVPTFLIKLTSLKDGKEPKTYLSQEGYGFNEALSTFIAQQG